MNFNLAFNRSNRVDADKSPIFSLSMHSLNQPLSQL